MNRHEFIGKISSVQAQWSSCVVKLCGQLFQQVPVSDLLDRLDEIGIANPYQVRTHGTTVKYSAHIIISIQSNCTKDKDCLITAYVHFLSKATELKNSGTWSHQPVPGVQVVKQNEINELRDSGSKTVRDPTHPSPVFFTQLLSSHHLLLRFAFIRKCT